MLKTRVVTALLLLSLVLSVILLAPRLFFVLITTLVVIVAAWEWTRLSMITTLLGQTLYVMTLLSVLGILFWLGAYHQLFWPWFFLPSLVVWLVILLMLIGFSRHAVLPRPPNWLVATLGVVSLAYCWQALLILQTAPDLLSWVLLIVCANDTIAYFAGRYWGKRPLAANISPNKTWEGLWIGLLGALVFSVLYYLPWFIVSRSLRVYVSVLIMSFIIVLAATTGDLFESWLKRCRGMKDSSQLLPGHGGVLDRIDSLLAAAPVFMASAPWIHHFEYRLYIG